MAGWPRTLLARRSLRGLVEGFDRLPVGLHGIAVGRFGIGKHMGVAANQLLADA